MKMMNYYVYSITNLLNSKVYIGRAKYNKKNFKTYYGSGKLIKTAIEKYGKENFKKEILYECETLLESKLKEIFEISKNNSFTPFGYNISKGGEDGDWWQYYDEKEKHSKRSSSVLKRIWTEDRNKMLSYCNINATKENRDKMSKKIKLFYDLNPIARQKASLKTSNWLKTKKGIAHIEKLKKINNERFSNMNAVEREEFFKNLKSYDREKRKQKVLNNWTEEKRKKASENSSNGLNPRARNFYTINITNKEVQFFNCIKECSKKISVNKKFITRCLNNSLGYYDDYIFIKNKPLFSDICRIIEQKIKIGTTTKKNKISTVLIKDLTIIEFDNRKECATFLKANPKVIINRVNKDKEFKGYRIYEY